MQLDVQKLDFFLVTSEIDKSTHVQQLACI